MVFFFRKSVSPGIQRIFLGFAAGVMIAASVWSPSDSAMEEAEAAGQSGLLPAVGGFLLGVAFLILLDSLLSASARRFQPAGRAEIFLETHYAAGVRRYSSQHSGGYGSGAVVRLAAQHAEKRAALSSAAALALGIGIQNFPEGAAFPSRLRQEGMSTGQAFLRGSLSGIVEPIFGHPGGGWPPVP